MIHRRPGQTDGEGPPDNNDYSVLQDVELRLVIGPPQATNRLRHVQSLLLQFPPQVALGDTDQKFRNRTLWLQHFRSEWSLLKKELPANLHLLSLDALGPDALKKPLGGTT